MMNDKSKRKPVIMTPCACGCGNLRPMYDMEGRRRQYISGHNPTTTVFKRCRKATNKKNISKEELVQLYLSEEKNMKEIAVLLSTTPKTIAKRLKEHHIPTRDTKIKKGQFKGKTFEELYGTEKAKEIKRKISIAQRGEKSHSYGKPAWNRGKKWPAEVVYKMLLRRTPNKEEQFLIGFLATNNLPYKFVGDGKLIIDNRNPDFINTNGQKKIIEFFGEHWHKTEDEEIKRRIYAQYGFDLLVIWGKELREEEALLEKVLIYNKKEVI